MVEFKYDFARNCWYKTFIDSDGSKLTMVHNPQFDGPAPEGIVLEFAKKYFDKAHAGFCIIKHTLVAYNVFTGEVNKLYDFKLDKFVYDRTPVPKPKMTLEQKKTLIKMIHEI